MVVVLFKKKRLPLPEDRNSKNYPSAILCLWKTPLIHLSICQCPPILSVTDITNSSFFSAELKLDDDLFSTPSSFYQLISVAMYKTSLILTGFINVTFFSTKCPFFSILLLLPIWGLCHLWLVLLLQVLVPLIFPTYYRVFFKHTDMHTLVSLSSKAVVLNLPKDTAL